MNETDFKNPEMLSIRQTAKKGILPETALRELVKQGKIKALRVGRTQYINVTALIQDLNDPDKRAEIWL